jgi:hypothetical protein
MTDSGAVAVVYAYALGGLALVVTDALPDALLDREWVEQHRLLKAKYDRLRAEHAAYEAQRRMHVV